MEKPSVEFPPWPVQGKSTARQTQGRRHGEDRRSQSRSVMERIRPRRSGLEWQESLWNRLNREMQMTSDAHRLVRLGTAAQRSAAKTAASQYCQVVRWDYDASS